LESRHPHLHGQTPDSEFRMCLPASRPDSSYSVDIFVDAEVWCIYHKDKVARRDVSAGNRELGTANWQRSKRKGETMAKAESCHNCVYAHWDLGLWVRTLRSGFPARPTCANHPESFGRMKECPPGRVCRNFRPRPPTPQGETVKTIPLGNGVYTYVDAADYEWLSQWIWHLHTGYAARYQKHKLMLMHRAIMQPPKGMTVDHQNRNRLDNTRANLRVCTHAENACNRGKRRGTSSRFRGVGYRKDSGKYYAQLYYEGEHLFLGLFTDEIEAAQAHDYKAVEVLGESARLNFPEEWPPRRRKRVHARFQASLKKGAKGVKNAKNVKGAKGKKAKRKKPKPARRPRATGHKSRATPKKAKRAKGKSKKGKGSQRKTHDARRGANRDSRKKRKHAKKNRCRVIASEARQSSDSRRFPTGN
jgi:hypothetical protein